MGEFNLHRVKRQARKEAWYQRPGEPTNWNPFRKTTTWATPSREPDVEAGEQDGGRLHQSVSEPLSRAINADDATTPIASYQSPPRTAQSGAQSTAPSEDEKVEMSGATIGSKGDDDEPVAVPSTSNGTARETPDAQPRARLNGKAKKSSEEVDKVAEENGNTIEKTRSTNSNSSKKSKPKKKFTLRSQLQHTILNSWINIFILAAPVGIGLYYTNVSPIVVFVINFIAIIPLAAMLSYATEEIALRVGETLGGLLNATFGNAVELIVAIIALTQKPAKTTIVKTSLIGSILSNLLLVMGMCFFFGGLRRTEQHFNITVAQTAASLLALALASIIVPTVFDSVTGITSVEGLSHGTAIILLLVYGCYLYFQLHTHQDVFAEESQKVPMKPSKHAIPVGGIAKGLAQAGGLGMAHGRYQGSQASEGGNDGMMNTTAYEDAADEEGPEEPNLHFWVAVGTLAASTVIIAFCAEFMVDSIDGLTAGGGISEEFIGLILLPIVGNAAEHATAVTVACKDKMDLAIGVAVGSSMQIALLVIPFTVVLGWILGVSDMTMSFDEFQVAVIFVAVLLVNYLIADGKSHWLEGVLLQSLYLIIAVCAWYYPTSDDS